eukprot:jgi/Hompol1/3045/HPOL_003095-RA
MEAITGLFSKPDPKEEMRKQQRAIKGEMRSLDRDLIQLSRQETELEQKIKQAAKKNDMALAKTLAKQLIKVRSQKDKNVSLKAKMGGIATQTKTMQSNIVMGQAMATTTGIMKAANQQMDPVKMQATLQEFHKETMMADMTDEMLNDALDGIMDESGDEEESQDIMNQVLDEIGITISHNVGLLVFVWMVECAGHMVADIVI